MGKVLHRDGLGPRQDLWGGLDGIRHDSGIGRQPKLTLWRQNY